MLVARAIAVIRGRDYVTPEDVKRIAVAVLGHRVTVKPELWMANIAGSGVIRGLLDSVAAPQALRGAADPAPRHTDPLTTRPTVRPDPRKPMTDAPRLELLPAVDIAGGEAVQLVQGVAGTGGQFGDPWEAAKAWQDQGAEWLHLVDLDAAFGEGSNAELLADIVGRLDLQVELSGGIRDAESLDRALATGCRRVNVGTAALEDPEWTARAIAEHGDRIAVGLDVRGTTLAARGWTRDGGDLWETLERLDAEGCARYVVTDVNKDGMLQGPNVELLRSVCGRTDRPVVASGGVTTLDDIRVLRGLVEVGVEGAIVGSALYKGTITLPEALDVAGRP